MKTVLQTMKAKIAAGTALAVCSSAALAQSDSEAAINAAIDDGQSMVGLVVGGLIGIAALVVGLGIVLSLFRRS